MMQPQGGGQAARARSADEGSAATDEASGSSASEASGELKAAGSKRGPSPTQEDDEADVDARRSNKTFRSARQ